MVKKSSWPSPGFRSASFSSLTSSFVESALSNDVELLSSRFMTTRCLYWRRAVACPEPIADEAATPNSKP